MITMSKTRLFTLGCVICVLIIATIARSFATPDKNASTIPATLSSNSGSSIGIVTGSKTGTYYIFGRDIADVAKRVDIDMEAKISEGSIDNIKRINSNENATIGIVQSDVLGFLGRSKNPNSVRMANNLRMIFPLYNEEVHVLARSEIKDFKDLQGKKVAIGENGSGNMLTSVNLFAITGVTPAETMKISPTQGVAVLKGEADAAIFVGGKPVRLFRNLEDLTLPENQKYLDMLQKVHFIPLDNPKMLEEYKPAKITHQDYNFVKEDVPTVAVPAILVSYNFADGANTKRCEQLRDLANALRAALPMLKDSGHPKWKEVDLDAKINNWKKDACVWVDLQNAKLPSLKL